MTRIRPIQIVEAEGKSRKLLETVKKQMGTAPNLFKGLAHSPAVLEFYLNQISTLSGGILPPKLREQIAVAVAGINKCDYCASAHTFLGKKAGISESELSANLAGVSTDEKTAAALRFARVIIQKRGLIDEEDLRHVRDTGYSDPEIVEIIAHVAVNVFTNYFNNIAGTEIDFPRVDIPPDVAAA